MVACLSHIGALIIRTGFWGPLYYNYNQSSTGNYFGPYSSGRLLVYLEPLEAQLCVSAVFSLPWRDVLGIRILGGWEGSKTLPKPSRPESYTLKKSPTASKTSRLKPSNLKLEALKPPEPHGEESSGWHVRMRETSAFVFWF